MLRIKDFLNRERCGFGRAMAGKGLFWIGGGVVFLQLIPAIEGWGMHGHYTTCKIAEAYLTEEALSVVKELLPESAEGELAAVCSWLTGCIFIIPGAVLYTILIPQITGVSMITVDFVEESEGEITWLLKVETRIMDVVKNTVDYFHGKSTREEGLKLFGRVRKMEH